jgi:GT2 family glycosyltransferase
MMSITIGITTRNRPESLQRCLESLRHVPDVEAVLVFDDASDPAVPAGLSSGRPPVHVIRDAGGRGYIAGRNRLVAEARTPYVLLLDDDAAVLSGEAVRRACAVLDADPRVGGVAFAQAEADGRPWPPQMQPGKSPVPAVVPSFIGFAHLLRRDLFLSLGGYRERLVSYGEEKDYCVRLMDAGYRVVFLPDALIAHIVDPIGRSQSRYVRYVIRNDVFTSLYTEPMVLAMAGVPVRLWRYTRMAKGIPGGDRGGLSWILSEVWRAWPEIRRARKPVAWATIRRWRRLARHNVPYAGGRPA